jgi:hypothetical protein
MQTQKKIVKIEMPYGYTVSGIIIDKLSVKVVEEDADNAWIILEEKEVK